ncbi:MAG TPA: hypothetical protein VGE25_06490 [Sediminibacterium sp.]
MIKEEGSLSKTEEENGIIDSKIKESSTLSNNAKLVLFGVAFILAIVLINYDRIFNIRISATQQQTDNTQQSEKSIFRPGYDFFEGIWTQIADENANPLLQSQMPIKLRISKKELFYYVEISFDNKEFKPLLGQGRYDKYGFTLRHKEFSRTSLEYKQDPNGDYLFEPGGSGYFKKLEN